MLDKANDGSWGKIAVWNATKLVSLNMKANKARVSAGQTLTYQLTVRNLGPAPPALQRQRRAPQEHHLCEREVLQSGDEEHRMDGDGPTEQVEDDRVHGQGERRYAAEHVITNEATLYDDISAVDRLGQSHGQVMFLPAG